MIAAVPLAVIVFSTGAANSASAAEAPVGLGLIGAYAVLGGETVTNEGLSVVTGNVGVSPGSAITGFPPGIVLSGVKHAADTEAAAARAAFTAAYNDAAGRTPTEVGIVDLVNRNLVAGVYSGGALSLTGTVTLTGDASSVFIFQATSSLITSSASVVALGDGVSPCNVFWQVLSSATIGSGSTFVGTILAGASITADSGTQVTGRLIAGSGQVELHNNVVTRPEGCEIGDDTETQAAADAAAAAAAASAITAATDADAARAASDAAAASATQAAADAADALEAAEDQDSAEDAAAAAAAAAASAQNSATAADASADLAESAAADAAAAQTAAEDAAADTELPAAEEQAEVAEDAATAAGDYRVAAETSALLAAQSAQAAADAEQAALGAVSAYRLTRLAATGAESTWMIGLALLLTGSGAALVAFRRLSRRTGVS